jgi:hypothetical protein
VPDVLALRTKHGEQAKAPSFLAANDPLSAIVAGTPAPRD